MKNTFGHSLCVTLFGESHGPLIGATLDGLAPGIPVDEKEIAAALEKRRPADDLATARREPDPFQIVSGVYRGFTTGTPLTVLIPNVAQKSEDYGEVCDLPRPGHADYTAGIKYHGYEDPRGGGHFSGRLTAALVAAGAIVSAALRQKGIAIGTHIARLGGVSDRPFAEEKTALAADLSYLEKQTFCTLDEAAKAAMRESIRQAARDGDSVGGILETAVLGVPAGVGEPWFDTAEGVLSQILFSVPGVKGVEFGAGFGIADLRGSQANDAYRIREGAVVTATNRNGGISGGITNGMPLLFRCAVRPTPSISKEQKTVSLKSGEETEIRVAGRHDPAIAPRAVAVVNAVCALALGDLLTQRFGTDWLKK